MLVIGTAIKFEDWALIARGGIGNRTQVSQPTTQAVSSTARQQRYSDTRQARVLAARACRVLLSTP